MMEYYLKNHKKQNLTICGSMYGSRGYFAKGNKSEIEKYHDFTYLWNLKNKINNFERDLWVQRAD